MGEVLVAARIENLLDAYAAAKGQIAAGDVRKVEVDDALVDTGASGLSMPRTLLATLGLDFIRNRTAMTASGPAEVRTFGPAKLTIQGRDCPFDVTELPDGCPVLIGQIPLEAMDWVADMPNRRVIGNPAHGGEQVIEIY